MPLFMRRVGTQFNGPFNPDIYENDPSEYETFDSLEDLQEAIGIVDVVKEQNEVRQVNAEKNNLSMGEEDKLASIRNADKILPPNLFITYQGKKQPKLSDVEAIVGFKVNAKQLQIVMDNIEE